MSEKTSCQPSEGGYNFCREESTCFLAGFLPRRKFSSGFSTLTTKPSGVRQMVPTLAGLEKSNSSTISTMATSFWSRWKTKYNLTMQRVRTFVKKSYVKFWKVNFYFMKSRKHRWTKFLLYQIANAVRKQSTSGKFVPLQWQSQRRAVLGKRHSSWTRTSEDGFWSLHRRSFELRMV